MRTLKRNKELCYYSNPNGTDYAVIDGQRVSEMVVTYDEPKPIWLAVTQTWGYTEPENFGEETHYRITILADNGCPMKDGCRIWRGRRPPEKHNFIVRKVFQSLNGITYGLREVVVS